MVQHSSKTFLLQKKSPAVVLHHSAGLARYSKWGWACIRTTRSNNNGFGESKLLTRWERRETPCIHSGVQ